MQVNQSTKLNPSVISSSPAPSGILVSVGSNIPGHPSPAAHPTHILTTDAFNSAWEGGAVPCWRGVFDREIMLVSMQLSSDGDFCFPHLEEIPEVSVWNACPGSDGQHYGDTLSEQDIGNQVQELRLIVQREHSLLPDVRDFSRSLKI